MVGRLQTDQFLKYLKVIAVKVKEKEGKIAFEWPTGIEGWNLKDVKELEEVCGLEKIKVH